MSITFDDTRPHVTLSVFRGDEPATTLNQVMDRLDAVVETLAVVPMPLPDDSRRYVRQLNPLNDDGVVSRGAWYRIEKPPAWLRESDGSSDTDGLDAGAETSDADAAEPGNTPGTSVAQDDPDATAILDVANHLVVLIAYRNFLGVYASQDTMRSRVNDLIELGEASNEVRTAKGKKEMRTVKIDKVAAAITRDELELAFVRGLTRNAWLEGLHVSTVLKADRKIMSGPDLRYALDRFGDQTFTYTAAISEFGQPAVGAATPSTKAARLKVGVSYSKKTLWTRTTKGFEEFVKEFKTLIDILLNPTPVPLGASELEQAGMPFVARPVTAGTLSALSGGFDIGYEAQTSPELELITGEVVPATTPVDLWQRSGRFVVDETKTGVVNPAEIVANAIFADRPIARVAFRPIRRGDRAVDILHRVDDYVVRKDDADLVALDRSLLKRNTNLTLRYSSGHVIQNGVLYTIHFRDVIFDRWRWIVFPLTPDRRPYKLADEKPWKTVSGKKVFAPERIGLDRSLFCYVRNNTASVASVDVEVSNDWWLLCDDGAGEIADFIAFDVARRFITFIHVKAWKDGSSDAISVTPFSEVVSQAIKNLRSFDQGLLVKELERRTTDHNRGLVWRASGAKVDREAFLAKLIELRQGAHRHVLLLQPRIHRRAWDRAVHAHRRGEEGPEIGRMRQLSALLSGAESTFQKLGATFAVVGVDNSTRPASPASKAATRSSKASTVKKRRAKPKR